MDTSRLMAMKELLDYLDIKHTQLRVIDYGNNHYEWDVMPTSEMTRADILQFCDRKLASDYGLRFGWVHLGIYDCIQNGTLTAGKANNWFLVEISQYLLDHDAHIALFDYHHHFPYELRGVESPNVFNKLVHDVAKSSGWLADWFMLEAKRMYDSDELLEENFIRVKDMTEVGSNTDFLDKLNDYLVSQQLTLYFWKEVSSGIIVSTTDSVDTDLLLSNYLDENGSTSNFEEELNKLWFSAESMYDSIKFRASSLDIFLSLINNWLITHSISLQMSSPNSVYFIGDEDSVVYLGRFTSFMCIHKVMSDKTEKELFKDIFEAVSSDGANYSNIFVRKSTELPTSLPIDFQKQCHHLMKRIECPYYEMFGQNLTELANLLESVKQEDIVEFLGQALILLAIKAESNNFSLSATAVEELKRISNYNYVPVGENKWIVVQDTKEVTI